MDEHFFDVASAAKEIRDRIDVRKYACDCFQRAPLSSQDRVAAELYTPAAGSASHDDPGSAAAFSEVGEFAGRGFDVTALRIKSALRQSLVQAVRISEQGITLDMPSTSKLSATRMLASQTQALYRTDTRTLTSFLQDCVYTTKTQLLPALLQPGAGAQRDANGLTVTHSAETPAAEPAESVWYRIQRTADAVLELHAFLCDVFGAPQLPSVHAELAELWGIHGVPGTVSHWLHTAIAVLPAAAFEQEGTAAAALKHVAAVRAAFLGGNGDGGPSEVLPPPDSTAPPSAMAAAAARSALHSQVYTSFLQPADGAGALPSLPPRNAVGGAEAEGGAAHEVKMQEQLASKGGSRAEDSWLEPIQGPSMLSRPDTARSAAAGAACDAMHTACALLQRWQGAEQAARTMSECLMQLPLIAKGGCVSRAAGGDAQACLEAVSDLAHVAHASTVCVGEATSAWADMPAECSEALARAAGVLDELRGAMRGQLQQAVLLLAREVRTAVAGGAEGDTPERAVQRGLLCLTAAHKHLSVCLQHTPRVAVCAHLLSCLLSCVRDSLGTEYERETPASKRGVQNSVEQWCVQHAPDVQFSHILLSSTKLS